MKWNFWALNNCNAVMRQTLSKSLESESVDTILAVKVVCLALFSWIDYTALIF